jgi:hypothetical protein
LVIFLFISGIQQVGYTAFVLFDPQPFPAEAALPTTEKKLIGGGVWKIVSVDKLVRDRYQHNCACNIWLIKK